MAENYHHHHNHQEQKATRPSRLRNAGGGGEIVEVQGGHIVRSTGRKDRHSKVCTAKGPRDRRVRLSAHTAIQFYDVQDRLGYDRPSKAVDWLIKKAKSAIDELAELPPWKPTATNLDSTTTVVNFEHNPDDENLNNQMDMEFHHNFPPSELISSRPINQNQDLKLSLQSFQDPILHHHHHQPPPPHHHHQVEQGMFFDGAGWPENQRLVSWGGVGGGGSGGDGVSGGFMFSSPPPPVFLQPLTNNHLFNYISQRGPLQSSNTPPVRAWVDPPAPFSGAAIDQTLAFSIAGFNSGTGFHIPARIQGEEQEHDGISDKPSSVSSDSRD